MQTSEIELDAATGEADALQEPSSDDLRGTMTRLQEELREQIKAGNGTGVIQLQLRLRELPLQITAAECREIRIEVDQINDELKQLKQDEQELVQLKGERIKKLVPLLDAYAEAKADVDACDLALASVDGKRQNGLERRRHLYGKLQTHLKGVDDEKFTN